MEWEKAGFAVVLQSTSTLASMGYVLVTVNHIEAESFLERDAGCRLVQAAGEESRC